MINLCTKFKVPACRHFEDMNGGAKCTNWGSLKQLVVTRGHPQCHRFRDIAGYLSKVADFDPHHLHLAPRKG